MPAARLPRRSHGCRSRVEERLLLPLPLVELLELAADALSSPVTAAKASSGMPSSSPCGRRADQAVAALDVVVEEAERLAGLERLHPQADLAQLHGHGVDVDAVDAVADDVAQGVPERRRAPGSSSPVRTAGQVAGEAVGGGDQEVAGAAGRVEDLEVERSASPVRLWRVCPPTAPRRPVRARCRAGC